MYVRNACVCVFMYVKEKEGNAEFSILGTRSSLRFAVAIIVCGFVTKTARPGLYGGRSDRTTR